MGYVQYCHWSDDQLLLDASSESVVIVIVILIVNSGFHHSISLYIFANKIRSRTMSRIAGE